MGCRPHRRLEGLQWFDQPTFARTGLAVSGLPPIPAIHAFAIPSRLENAEETETRASIALYNVSVG